MINLSINNRSYTTKHRWEEITLSECCELATICKTMPACLKERELFISEGEVDKLKEWVPGDGYDEMISFMRMVFGFFSDVPNKVINSISPDYIESLYLANYDHMVFAVMNKGAGYSRENIQSFEYKETYYLPKNHRIGLLHKEWPALTLEQFCEAANILNSLNNLDNFRLYSLFVAILCQPKEVDYTEDYAHKMFEPFMDLTMDIVYEVSGSFIDYYGHVKTQYPSLLSGRGSGKVFRAGWNGLIYDIYKSSNYLLSLQEIKQSPATEWFRVMDHETEIIKHQNEEQRKRQARK